MDTRVSRDTRIEVVTEGVLTRMLQTDPALDGVAAVIFDEFHERSLQADLGLALTIDARNNLTPELKLLVMSATLDGESVAKLLDDAPIVAAPGRMFPVESRFVGKGAPLLPPASFVPGQHETPEGLVARTVARALREEQGDVLVFLPGAREIRRVQSLLESSGLESSVRVLPLYGELSGDDQEAALRPAAPGIRKVVLATNIAETSLTIQGVRIIVDSGLVRRSVFDPATGMSRLETQRISRASAEQRQGRAGRIEAGVCYRIWSEGAQRSLAPFTPPEIVEADLAPLALELAGWGTRDASELRWLDTPPSAMLASARDLLVRLGALEASGRITQHGRQMARLSVHPRLAHMLLRATDLRSVPLAVDLAALLSERDLLRAAGGSRDADIRSRLELVRGEGIAQGADRAGLQRARRAAKDLLQQVRSVVADDARPATQPHNRTAVPVADATAITAGTLLAFAYPDRIARRRPGTDGARYTLANGRGAHFAEVQNLAKQDFIVAVDLDDRERDARILLAAPLTRDEIEEHLSDRLERGESVEWNSRDQAVLARRFVRLDAITLEEKPLQDVPVEAARMAMLEGIRDLGLDALPWTRDARDLQARMEFVRRLKEGDPPLAAPSAGAATNNAAPATSSARSGAASGSAAGAASGSAAGATSGSAAGATSGSAAGAASGSAAGAASGSAAGAASGSAAGATSGSAAGAASASAAGATFRAVSDAAPHAATAPDDDPWPTVSDEALAATTDVWLAPWLDGVTRRDHLARLSLPEILRGLLPWDKQRQLDHLAPTHLQVPSGSNIRIDYLDESAPAVSVRLQEVFGLDATPQIGGGRVPITFKLLSPAQRPVQVTRDLASFWRGSYAEVRKDMRGRYPKHYWPENPLEAEATRGVRRRT
jgi:ATP-dependent helicase HrpB